MICLLDCKFVGEIYGKNVVFELIMVMLFAGFVSSRKFYKKLMFHYFLELDCRILQLATI